MDEDDADEDRRQEYAGGQNIRDRAGAFASRVVRCCERWNRDGGVGRIMAPQLVKCATSVAGMLEEARAAESRRDFISKCCIALKECREAHRRLQIAEGSKVEPLHEAQALRSEAGELVAIISAIVRNTKRNSAVTTKRRSRSRLPNS
jgi:four helix bundle protein